MTKIALKDKYDKRQEMLTEFYFELQDKIIEKIDDNNEISSIICLIPINEYKQYSLVFDIINKTRYVHFVEYYHKDISINKSHRCQILLNDY